VEARLVFAVAYSCGALARVCYSSQALVIQLIISLPLVCLGKNIVFVCSEFPTGLRLLPGVHLSP